jgi:hypothetical protein
MTNRDDTTSSLPSRMSANVRAARSGPGANCSSLGSAVDALFLGSVAVGALLASAATALAAAEASAAEGKAPEPHGPTDGEEAPLPQENR